MWLTAIRRRSSGSGSVTVSRRSQRVGSVAWRLSPTSRGVAVSPRAVVQAQQLPPSRVSRPPGLLESACGRGPQKGRTQSFAVPSCCRPVARRPRTACQRRIPAGLYTWCLHVWGGALPSWGPRAAALLARIQGRAWRQEGQEEYICKGPGIPKRPPYRPASCGFA